MNTLHEKKDTILKILIYIGILAIILSLGVRFGLPFANELRYRSEDSGKVADIQTVDRLAQAFVKAHPDTRIGEPNTVYISLGSENEDCSDLELPTIPDGWKYHCVSSANLGKLDGTGWIPANFSGVQGNLTALPVSPTTSDGALDYYTFTTTRKTPQTTWLATALLRSRYFLRQTASTDGGSDPLRYELGNNHRLW